MNGVKNSGRGRGPYNLIAPSVRVILPDTKSKHWYKRLYQMATRKIEYEVTEDYTCYIPFLHITLFIPKGFIFDGASIPKFLWPIIAPVDVLFIAAVFHDFAYKYRGYLTVDKKLYLVDQDRKTYDIIFKRLSYCSNGLIFASNAAYSAIRAFGIFSWNTNRKTDRRIKVDFPELGIDKIEIVTKGYICQTQK